MIKRVQIWLNAFRATGQEITPLGAILGTAKYPAKLFKFLFGKNPKAVFGNILNNFGRIVHAIAVTGRLPRGIGVGAFLGSPGRYLDPKTASRPALVPT